VGGEQVVGERVERRDRGGEQEQAAGAEGRDAPGLSAAASDQDYVGDGEGDDAERRLRMK
jgi:hypothetical protein